MASKKSQGSLQIWQIAKVNLRHNFLPLLLLCTGVMILTPVLFGTVGLDPLAVAVPLEMLISIMGILLLVPVFEPEANRETEDIVRSKYVDLVYVYVIRIAYSVTALLLLILMFCGYMRLHGCYMSASLIFGTLADAMFLGSIGLFTSAAANNLPVSFMIPVLYYVLNFTKRSKLGVFNLFSMMGGDYSPNIWLLGAGIVLMAAAVAIKRTAVKFR